MKKATLVLFMMAWAYIVHSQQIIYTISASINGETTHLDSILFENLENQTRFVAGDLPLLPAYDIDLSLQLLVTGMNQINLPTGMSFRLTKHIPGEIGLQFTGSVAEQARLTVYSMSGQMVFARRLPVVNPQEVITVNIPGSGMYVLSLETSHGRVHFKALGSPAGVHNSFSLSVMAQPVVAADAVPAETPVRTALPDDGFSYQVGDSLRVTAFLDGHYTQPHGGRITGSRSISFTMLQGTAFTDPRDGQVYRWVKIGDQIWMAENLKYLPSVVGPGTGSETDPYYYVYGYDGKDASAAKETENYRNYGVLYNWPAAMAGASSSSTNPSGVQGVCPPGWHLPSHNEWTELERFVCETLGNADCDTIFPYDDETWGWRGTNEGNALKSCRQENSPHGASCNTSEPPRWNAHNTHYGTDAFGFSALPGGFRSYDGSFFSVGGVGYLWAATEYAAQRSWYRSMANYSGNVYRLYYVKSGGFNVRCLKDKDSETDSYTLTLIVSPPEAGSVQGAGEFRAGEQVSISATANPDWEFDNWTDSTGEVVATTADHDFVMPANNVTLTATFRKEESHETQVVDVTNPATGKTWMDRNLGASRAATNSTDAEAYGDLYQWGRAADGHQKRTSGTTSTISSSDTPGHGNFILSNSGANFDWRSPQNANLWQGVNGVNNPCPPGYRLPTESELNAERESWGSSNSAGAFASPLKLPVAGYRFVSNGSLDDVGSFGYYWSSTVVGVYSRYLGFNSTGASMSNVNRAYGFSVRCLKD